MDKNPVAPLEHVGGPFHLQVRAAPEGQSRGYTLHWPVRSSPVLERSSAGEMLVTRANAYLDSVEVSYTLRTIGSPAGILWVGYVADDYGWE